MISITVDDKSDIWMLPADGFGDFSSELEYAVIAVFAICLADFTFTVAASVVGFQRQGFYFWVFPQIFQHIAEDVFPEFGIADAELGMCPPRRTLQRWRSAFAVQQRIPVQVFI